MPRFAANLTWMFHEHAFPHRFDAAREKCPVSLFVENLDWARNFGIGAG